MLFIPVIGVQGSGHSLIKSLAKYPSVSIDGADAAMVAWWTEQTQASQDRAIAALKSIESSGAAFYLSTTSFPYNNPRDSMRRPNMPDLLMTGYPTKCLRIKRNPVACVMSAVRRGFTNDVKLQSRIVEDNHCYIEFHMRLEHFIKASMTIPYELFFEADGSGCRHTCDTLAEWLGMPWISERAKSIVKVHSSRMEKHDIQWVESYFSKAGITKA